MTGRWEDYHIGGANAFTGAVWAYTDDTEVASPNSNWNSGFPDYRNNKNQCMYIKEPDDYEQRNESCDQNYGYLCQIDPFA